MLGITTTGCIPIPGSFSMEEKGPSFQNSQPEGEVRLNPGLVQVPNIGVLTMLSAMFRHECPEPLGLGRSKL